MHVRERAYTITANAGIMKRIVASLVTLRSFALCLRWFTTCPLRTWESLGTKRDFVCLVTPARRDARYTARVQRVQCGSTLIQAAYKFARCDPRAEILRSSLLPFLLLHSCDIIYDGRGKPSLGMGKQRIHDAECVIVSTQHNYLDTGS